MFAVMTNVLALADLYKEPIDGLSVDHVRQEITHKDMCHGELWVWGRGGGSVDMNGVLISR